MDIRPLRIWPISKAWNLSKDIHTRTIVNIFTVLEFFYAGWPLDRELPHGNEICRWHIQLLATKIYISTSFKYMSSICQIYIYKIYVKYILNIQLLVRIYFIRFDIYLTCIFFPCGWYFPDFSSGTKYYCSSWITRNTFTMQKKKISCMYHRLCNFYTVTV